MQILSNPNYILGDIHKVECLLFTHVFKVGSEMYKTVRRRSNLWVHVREDLLAHLYSDTYALIRVSTVITDCFLSKLQVTLVVNTSSEKVLVWIVWPNVCPFKE